MGNFKKELQKLSVDEYKQGEVTPWQMDQYDDTELAQFGRCGGRCGGGGGCGCGCGGGGGCGCGGGCGGCFRRCGGGCGFGGGCFPCFPFFPFIF